MVLSEQRPDGRVLELARFDLVEALRAEAPAVVTTLADAGMAVQLLSGDRAVSVRRVAAQAGIAQAAGECTPVGGSSEGGWSGDSVLIGESVDPPSPDGKHAAPRARRGA